MEEKSVFPKGSIVGFDFEKMVVLVSCGYTHKSHPVCETESITGKEREQLVDSFRNNRAAGRT